jgi:uncharacterized protein YeaO (DUF488 family)
VTLTVRTARIDYKASDRLDITRKTGKEGRFLAPSWDTLRPVIDARREFDALVKLQKERDDSLRDAVREKIIDMQAAWLKYVPAYIDEMRASYRRNRKHWDALLARDQVTLVCYCTNRMQCHRAILRTEILPRLGAADGGEVA